jgi:hypothetical protein
MGKNKSIPISILLTLFFLASGPSCDRGQRPGPEPGGRGAIPARGGASRRAVTEIELGADFRVAAGQTIYVPAYSHIGIGDNARPFNLAVTVSIRNTDQAHPIVISSVSYHDSDGRIVREFLKRPLRVSPMATQDFFITESDTSGGSSSSFLVKWVAEQSVSDPVVEAVMIGTAGTQGISFTCPGRIILDRPQ